MSIDHEILTLEREALDNWSSGNVPGYLKHAASDMTYFDDIGAQNGVIGLEAVQGYAENIASMVPEHKYKIIKPNIQMLGDVAILTFQYHPFSSDDIPQTKWRATSVYSKRHGQWKLVHSHWSMNKQS